MKKKLEESPGYARYEDDDDIIEIRPTSWKMVITEKDSGSQYDCGTFNSKKDARTAMMQEIKKTEEENGENEHEDSEYEFEEKG